MGIKKKIRILLIGALSIILLVSCLFTYLIFRKAMTEQIVQYQESTITMNATLVDTFMNTIRQISLQLVSDESFGHYLSSEPEDVLDALNIRTAINNQFSHYLTAQLVDTSYTYRNTLFLNEQLPLSKYYETKSLDSNTYSNSSNIFSNTEVTNTDWYLYTVNSQSGSHVFINKGTNELCFAQRIQNNYYTGPFNPEGIAVMVTSVKLSLLDRAFSLKPITPNSGYAILNEKREVIFQTSKDLPADLYTILYKENSSYHYTPGKSQAIFLNSDRFFVNTNNLNYHLALVYVTPYNDLNKNLSQVTKHYVALVLIIGIIFVTVLLFITNRITKPIIILASKIGSITDTRKIDDSTFDMIKDYELVVLCNNFKQLMNQVNQLIMNIKEKSKAQKESELRTLQAQINPHFLFNTMDIINWLALSRNQDDIANIVSSVANLMRYSIAEPDSMVTLNEEINNIYEFLSIYQLRYSGKITFTIEENTPIDNIVMPKYIIQPLVENSLRHGMFTPDTPIDIYLSAKVAADITTIFLKDNGRGCDPVLMNDYLKYETDNLNVTNGFGIRNVNERISLRFKNNSKLFYFIDDNGMLTACIELHFKDTQILINQTSSDEK